MKPKGDNFSIVKLNRFSKFLSSQGYVFCRQRGTSHKIYKNIKTNKIACLACKNNRFVESGDIIDCLREAYIPVSVFKEWLNSN